MAIGHDDQGPASELVSRWKQTKIARLGELRDLCVASLDELKAKERTLQRFRQELKDKLAAAPTDWVTSLGASAKSLVGYRVSDGDDASVSIGQLLMLVLLILAGILLAWLASRLARRYMLRFFGLHPGTAAALKSMVFYCLCLIFGVVSFRLLHVPMTAFAFMGGAAAIAIGFGGQDIMNNFMSGIILLVEQPIRVGDVVELEGTRGVVLHIGLRSTRLQTQTNYELIVPNHSLLDSSVTNLTLSDNFVQTFVTISVERDVDVQKSKWRMLEIAFGHPLVMKSPRPAALMTEVDTYWITFEIHFWVEYSNYMQIALVQSRDSRADQRSVQTAASDIGRIDERCRRGPNSRRAHRGRFGQRASGPSRTGAGNRPGRQTDEAARRIAITQSQINGQVHGRKTQGRTSTTDSSHWNSSLGRRTRRGAVVRGRHCGHVFRPRDRAAVRVGGAVHIFAGAVGEAYGAASGTPRRRGAGRGGSGRRRRRCSQLCGVWTAIRSGQSPAQLRREHHRQGQISEPSGEGVVTKISKVFDHLRSAMQPGTATKPDSVPPRKPDPRPAAAPQSNAHLRPDSAPQPETEQRADDQPTSPGATETLEKLGLTDESAQRRRCEWKWSTRSRCGASSATCWGPCSIPWR